MHRRDVLKLGALGTASVALGPAFWRWALAAPAVPGPSPYGPLLAPDANGIRLPEGFTSRVIARTHQAVGPTAYRWHPGPDGGAVFPMLDGGWVYVSNAEVPFRGGASSIRFSATGDIVGAQAILLGTQLNCAGGATPWGTWLSCEEHELGLTWECDPLGATPAVVRPALGTFKHEAAAVDPVHGHVYLTEDERDGRLYRFVPDAPATPDGRLDLSSGRLEAASVAAGGALSWHTIPQPNVPTTRRQVPETSAFDGGEGAFYDSGFVYITTKGDNRVWAIDTTAQTIEVVYDGVTSGGPLRGVDNVVVSSAGDLYVAEDGDDMQICIITADADRIVAPVLQVDGHDGSEITGPAFSPDGSRLYFSSQRGPLPARPTHAYERQAHNGVTYEVTGPFRTA